MRFWIGVTDDRWFRFLSAQEGLDEANFWQPGGKQLFRALQPGELFFFKLHSPNDFIVGGGAFSHSSLLPCSVAWEAFEQKNGAPSLNALRGLIAKYRGRRADPTEDFTIGCILLQSPVFWPREAWVPIPRDWSPNLVKGRRYQTEDAVGMALWRELEERLMRVPVASSLEVREPPRTRGEARWVRQRIGQGTFRVLITDEYQRRCAVTGERALPVLEAAHIVPVADGGGHWLDNGLLLRSDLHRLYDRGYLTITPDLEVRVSGRLREEFGNGEIYYPFQGKRIWTPSAEASQPNRDFLALHAGSIFRP